VIDEGKRNLLGVLVDAVDYEAAAERIVSAAKAGRPYGVSTLAVHGVMTAVGNRTQRYRVNALDLVTPDGQPVRWGLNVLHRAGLPDRVYGPTLMLEVCRRASEEALPIYLYGSTSEVVGRLAKDLEVRFPGLQVAGAEASRFRTVSPDEKEEITARVVSSGARITFVGLGCPRQEVFAFEYREGLRMPVVAVGAAFDYHAGLAKEPSLRVQRLGLQWAYRLAQDPRRLWRRYLLLNPTYLFLLMLQASKAWHPDTAGIRPLTELRYG
jgi:N-acetylglucosaminyldiphosphoundecaprenol N-acetyl-beta-D-mannosaminyltransferase